MKVLVVGAGAVGQVYASHLRKSGAFVALMVKPGPEFFALVFALFRAGAVPVLIDPGIDRRALKQCLDEAAPEAFVGVDITPQ